MNKIVFFKDGVIMEVSRGNRRLKRHIKLKESVDGFVPYRFSGPWPVEDCDA